jgi:hypothetical protein
MSQHFEQFDAAWLNHFMARAALHKPSPEAVEKEADLHYQIMDFCRDRGWQFLHGSMSERTHRTLGEPDFTILASMGRKFLVECKSRTGKLSQKQREFIHQATRNGHVIHVVDCMDEFLKIFVDEHHQSRD